MKKVFIGVDVGKDGGVVALDGNQKIISCDCIPRIDKKVDYKALFKILLQHKRKDVIVAIEDVHSIFGTSAKSNFSFGEIKGVKTGMVEAMSVIHGWRYIMVQPKKWQATIWNSTDMIYKPKKEDWKEGDRRRVNTKKLP